MPKKESAESVYVDVVGVSEKSWEDAGRRAIETARLRRSQSGSIAAV